MADEDAVWSVKNSFFLGCYEQAISEANGANVSDAGRVLVNFYMYRAYIEQGQHLLVLNAVRSDAPTALQAVKLLATYLGDDKDKALKELKELLSSPSAAAEPQLLLVAGLIYCHETDYKEALKYTHQSTDLEIMSLVAHIYLLMSRLDLARKQVGHMQQSDDDATLTKLAGAWVSMAEGGHDKCHEAYLEFQELGEKYNYSLMLYNGMALASLHKGDFEEAESILQNCLSKSSSDVDTLANTIVCMQQLRKPPQEVINRYVTQLKSISKTHPWTAKYSELEKSFDRCAAQFAGA